ncbi:MAG: signal peptidase II [Planctomycetes bacterium]|nr:signal peptidase II [Planctomycetota bacterium]
MNSSSVKLHSSIRVILSFLIPAVIALSLDLWTKAYMFEIFEKEGQIVLWDNFLYFTQAWNPGVAFGMMQHFSTLLLYATPLLLIGIPIYAWLHRSQALIYILCLGAIMGGAVGNYYDRLVFGKVRDFIDVRLWSWDYPVFNIADAFISCSVALLIFYSVFFERKKAPDEQS